MSWRVEVGEDVLIWIVALAASIDALFQGFQGLADHRLDHFWLWIACTALIFGLALVVERTKSPGGAP